MQFFIKPISCGRAMRGSNPIFGQFGPTMGFNFRSQEHLTDTGPNLVGISGGVYEKCQ